MPVRPNEGGIFLLCPLSHLVSMKKKGGVASVPVRHSGESSSEEGVAFVSVSQQKWSIILCLTHSSQ